MIFGMIRSHKQYSLDPNNTKLFDESVFYKAVSIDIKNASNSISIESPFITIRRATEFGKMIKRLRGNRLKVTIYTRNPKTHDGSLEYESWEGIRILRKSGAKVFICNDMRHRKIAIIDNHILWEGSLNMLSQNNSREVMRRTVSSQQCYLMSQLLRNKWYSRK